jgi:hypothetical protein
MLNRLLKLIALCLLSFPTFAIDNTLCSSPNENLKSYYGNFERVVLGEATNFKNMVKVLLINHAQEIDRIVNLSEEYSGPDEHYVPRLISLLGENAGFKNEISCMWSKYKKGDEIRSFSEDSNSYHRKGYVILRKGTAIAHFYNQLAIE